MLAMNIAFTSSRGSPGGFLCETGGLWDQFVQFGNHIVAFLAQKLFIWAFGTSYLLGCALVRLKYSIYFISILSMAVSLLSNRCLFGRGQFEQSNYLYCSKPRNPVRTGSKKRPRLVIGVCLTNLVSLRV